MSQVRAHPARVCAQQLRQMRQLCPKGERWPIGFNGVAGLPKSNPGDGGAGGLSSPQNVNASQRV